MTGSGAPPGPKRGGKRPTKRHSLLQPLLWRLHFFGGFLVAPIVLSLAITGILYAWNPQIEAALHHETLTATAEEPARPLGEQVSAAQAQYPDWQVHAVTPAPEDSSETTGVTLAPPPDGSARLRAPSPSTSIPHRPTSPGRSPSPSAPTSSCVTCTPVGIWGRSGSR
ncbi:hypothetical protein GCM10022402_11620 [Salinactinospora qingdaonensis]|uniref:PepSY-associated TM region n=1 Tax=Salinactinospora qingdaonensis TaxID=702744 RepID=A0ABP7F6Y0_9ACTN